MIKRSFSIFSLHYFDINAELVFEMTTEHIEDLQDVLGQIVSDIT